MVGKSKQELSMPVHNDTSTLFLFRLRHSGGFSPTNCNSWAAGAGKSPPVQPLPLARDLPYSFSTAHPHETSRGYSSIVTSAETNGRNTVL